MSYVKAFLFCAVLFADATSRSAIADPYQPAPPTDHSKNWCEGDIPDLSIDKILYADGGTIQVGPYSFRACQQMVEPKQNGKRVARYYYNPQRVEELNYGKAMFGLIINGLVTWEGKKEASLRSHRRTGTHLFGGISYDVHQYFHPLTQEKNDRRTFVYNPDNSDAPSDLPDHIITCSKTLDLHPEQSVSCRINVGYDQIWAGLLFLGGGLDLTPIPFDLFPVFAADVYRVLETGDVTEELQSGELELPRLD